MFYFDALDLNLINAFTPKTEISGLTYLNTLHNTHSMFLFWIVYILGVCPILAGVGWLLRRTAKNRWWMERYGEGIMKKPGISGSCLFFVV